MKSRYANGLLLIPIVRNKIIMHSGAGVIKNYFFLLLGKISEHLYHSGLIMGSVSEKVSVTSPFNSPDHEWHFKNPRYLTVSFSTEKLNTVKVWLIIL